MSSGVAETILRRDRIIVLSALTVIVALSWAYISSLASDMQNTDVTMGMAMPQVQTWGAADFTLAFAMWSVMMVAMMTPSAAPMILMFAGINRRRQNQQAPYVPTSVFLVGYLVVWAAFSVLAAAAQWGLHAVSLLSPMMVSTSPVLSGIRLLVGCDGLTLCRGSDELAVGRCYCRVHHARKGGPGGSADGPSCRGLIGSRRRSVVRASTVGWGA